MKTKWPLFLGILLLLAGILMRKLPGYAMVGLAMILIGVGLKTYYIISKARSGDYKPGAELWYLFLGLVLFFSGLYLKNRDSAIEPLYLILTGIALKVIFIVKFIRLTRSKPQAANS